MSWAMVIGGGLAAAGSVYASNQAKNSQQAALDAAQSNKLDPAQVGMNSLNAQANLAPQALMLNQLYGGQFAGSNNVNLAGSLFGQNAYQQQLSGDPNFQSLPSDIQQYLTSQAGSQGLNKLGSQFSGKSQYENLLSIYQGMGGQLGTPEQADAFNKWTEDKGFGGWGDTDTGGNALAAGLGKWADTAKNTPTPGVTDLMAQADAKLNPNYQASLDQLKTASGQAPATINAQGVTQSPYAGSLSQFMANGTAPQIIGPSGPNQGMEHLSNLLGSSGYQAVQGQQAQGMWGPNFAGPAATAAGPQLGAAAQGQIGQSQAPVTINAPGSIQQLTGSNVQAPQGFERVNAPGGVANVQGPNGVANVNAQTGFERVNAPNVNLSSVNVGQNNLLTNLTNSGFNANRPIQQTLEQQAQGDLALGGQLSADQTRLAQQASRSAAEARGMAGSNGAMLNEVQRQLDMSRQLQNERRNFAAGVEQQGFGQLATQQGQAIQAAGVTNDYLGLGLNAQNANNQNALALGQMGLQANLANQAAGLQGNQLNLQGQLANQNAALDTNRMGLQANLANQQAGIANNQLNMQGQLANQQAGLDLSRLGLQAGLANQSNNFAVQQGNQNANLNLAQMGLQAQTQNAANQMNNSQFNAGQFQQGSQFNAGQANQQAQLLAQLGLQAGQFNAGQLNQMGQFNAGQADSAANRYNQLQQFNAGQNQQANLANQNAFAQNYGQQMSGANSLANLFNTQVDQNMNAQQANQNAWLNQRGQTMSGLQNLLGSDNQLGMFNATQGQNAQQFNAGQQQLGFQNQLAYQQAVAQGRMDPMAALGFANGQANWGMFDPFNQSILSMYAGNQQNAANAQMAYGNNNAAINAGLLQSLGGIAGGVINAYGNKGG